MHEESRTTHYKGYKIVQEFRYRLRDYDVFDSKGKKIFIATNLFLAKEHIDKLRGEDSIITKVTACYAECKHSIDNVCQEKEVFMFFNGYVGQCSGFVWDSKKDSTK